MKIYNLKYIYIVNSEMFTMYLLSVLQNCHGVAFKILITWIVCNCDAQSGIFVHLSNITIMNGSKKHSEFAVQLKW